MIEQMVASLAVHKPEDPVPFIYRFLKEVQKGVDPTRVEVFTPNELNEARNFHKKQTEFKLMLKDREYPESSDSESDIIDRAVLLKKNFKKQRRAISTEIIPMNYPTDIGRPMTVGKSGSARAKLLQVMAKIAAFQHLSNDEIDSVVNSFQEV